MTDKLSKIKIFVTDLDGTLFLQETEVIPQNFFRKIKRWRKTSGLWIVATGRPDDRLREFFKNWEVIPDFYIVEERYIYSINSRKKIIPFSGWNDKLQKLSRKTEDKQQELVGPLLSWIEKENVKVNTEESTFVFEKIEDAWRAAGLLADTLPAEFKPLRNRVHLSVAPREVGKGRCLEEIISRENYSPQQLFCVGDSVNDLDMLDGRYGYFAATVANAEEKIKKTVRRNSGIITRANGGPGAIECLDKLLDTGEKTR